MIYLAFFVYISSLILFLFLFQPSYPTLLKLALFILF